MAHGFVRVVGVLPESDKERVMIYYANTSTTAPSEEVHLAQEEGAVLRRLQEQQATRRAEPDVEEDVGESWME